MINNIIKLNEQRIHIDCYQLARFLFAALLVFCYVGLAPFSMSGRDIELSETGYSNVIRQIIFLLFFSASFYTFIMCSSFDKLKCWKGFSLILVVCLLSVLWATHPSVSFRRSVLLIITSLSVMMLISILSKDDVVDLLTKVVVSLVVISFISCFFIPGAKHIEAELTDPGLIGNWKGIFSHKNGAGPTAVMSIFLCAYQYIRSRKISWILLIFVSLVFLYFTKSKTSLYLFLPSLLIAIYLFSVTRFRLGKLFNCSVFFAACAFSVVLSDYLISAFNHILDDPAAFTGRSTIWNLLYLSIQDHFWLGLGYGSVWRVGDDMTLVEYAHGWIDWVFTLTTGHSGYLDLFASIGFLGTLIFLSVFVVAPVYKLCTWKGSDYNFLFLLSAVFFFTIFRNFLESGFLVATNGNWLLYLSFYLLLYKDSATTR
ncbi:O-antigen ligase family protein [Rheinheimera sp. NSM]|uniref:O-antigen ligase family protein n=1 Tax=Rheinheimera sp. NSM TaxID=3457884 RepID=UPI004035A5AB